MLSVDRFDILDRSKLGALCVLVVGALIEPLVFKADALILIRFVGTFAEAAVTEAAKGVWPLLVGLFGEQSFDVTAGVRACLLVVLIDEALAEAALADAAGEVRLLLVGLFLLATVLSTLVVAAYADASVRETAEVLDVPFIGRLAETLLSGSAGTCCVASPAREVC